MKLRALLLKQSGAPLDTLFQFGGELFKLLSASHNLLLQRALPDGVEQSPGCH